MISLDVPVAPIRFDGQIAIVTGATRGIGRVMAKCFAAAGATVVISSRQAEEVTKLEREIDTAGNKALGIAADLAKPEEMIRLVETTIGKFGRVNVLVNNLGVAGPTTPVENTAIEDWNNTIATNLTSAFVAIRECVPTMKKQGSGAIVNIGSGLGKIPLQYRVCYGVTKMAMIGMTRVLAAELGPFGIRVNTVVPGSVEGDRNNEVYAAQAAKRNVTMEQVKSEMVANTALRSQVAPQSIVNMTMYLASDHAMHMTGQDINVTAGLIMF